MEAVLLRPFFSQNRAGSLCWSFAFIPPTFSSLYLSLHTLTTQKQGAWAHPTKCWAGSLCFCVSWSCILIIDHEDCRLQPPEESQEAWRKWSDLWCSWPFLGLSARPPRSGLRTGEKESGHHWFPCLPAPLPSLSASLAQAASFHSAPCHRWWE